tara:strand:- start:35 stop:292 length:258 start_codon:yes stop_codon:yes gene_type:complete
MDKTFTKKLLEADFTGNAVKFHCAFTVEKDGKTEVFGATQIIAEDELKLKSEWSESDIDAKAEEIFGCYSEEQLNAVFDGEEENA